MILNITEVSIDSRISERSGTYFLEQIMEEISGEKPIRKMDSMSFTWNAEMDTATQEIKFPNSNKWTYVISSNPSPLDINDIKPPFRVNVTLLSSDFFQLKLTYKVKTITLDFKPMAAMANVSPLQQLYQIDNRLENLIKMS